VSKERKRVVGRRSVGTLQSSERLGELVYAEAFAQGVEGAGQVVVLGDGARWIAGVKEQHFPNAELRLDAFHLVQALRRGLRSAYPDDRHRRRGQYAAVKALIWDGELGKALHRLRLIAHHHPQATELHKTIEYLQSRSEQIPAYGALQVRGEMISSALAEELVDRAFNARFKGNHRHWGRDSADALLALCMLAHQDQWDQYWRPAKQAA